MTPGDQGRFCNACAKTVVDFSMMSDLQVLNYFSTVSDEKVCGRALPDQLNRNMTMPREPKKRWFWYWNYVAMFFMLFSKSNQAKAQRQVINKTEQKPTCNKVMMGTMVAPQMKADHVIKGRVTNSDGQPLIAALRFRGTQVGVSSDVNGMYQIQGKNGDVIEVSAIGYETFRVSVRGFPNISEEINVTLNAVTDKMEVVVTAGAISYNRDWEVYTEPNQVYEIKILDKQLHRAVSKASLIIKKAGDDQPKTISTSANGTYQLRKIKQRDFYQVTVNAEGYESTDFSIKGSRVDRRKIIKEIYLVKKAGLQKLQQPVNTLNPIVDDLQYTRIDHNHVAEQGKVINQPVMMGAMVSGVQVLLDKPKEKRSIIKITAKKIADSLGLAKPIAIQLYPNPVRSGRSFLVSLNLPQQGNMEIRITDINGRVVLQKQINTTSKDHLEKIETDSRWPAGMYFLNVFNSNGGQQGKPISAVSFVVQ